MKTTGTERRFKTNGTLLVITIDNICAVSTGGIRVDQQCVVYSFKCSLCDKDYVGFTNRHLHQRIVEHSSSRSSIGKHMRQQHGLDNPSITENFTVLRKCRNKFDCLLYEVLFIKELKPSLNVESDSITVKVF